MGRKNDVSPSTRAAQALRLIDERTGAVVPGIELASTFARDHDYAPRQAYIYGRDGGPTVEHAEAVMASLDGAAQSFMFASGMAALVALMETLRPGDHVVAQKVMYHGGLAWLRRKVERHGIELSLFDTSQPETLKDAIRPGKTRIVWIETPVNPTWDVVDITAAADLAHQAGALLAVDCTTAPPCTSTALGLGADIAFHSATKYLGGHSDLTAGVLSLRKDDDLAQEIKSVRYMLGGVLSAFEAWLLIRGIRTLFLRYERASENALAIARHFETHPKIASVLYPGLPTHPGHNIAAKQMIGGFGGMMSLRLTGGFDAAAQTVRACRVFVPATSLGGVESLIEHRKPIEGPQSEVPDDLLRLSVGVEDVNDLISDLEQALGGKPA
ncbi:trans-sulfuration enzyme family protein [Halovulum sp. GXIMD14793]